MTRCRCCDEGFSVNFSNDNGDPEHLIPCVPFSSSNGDLTYGFIYPCTKEE